MNRTHLHAIHLKLGAKIATFGDWEMPIQYTGIFSEHAAVRNHVGIFDVSHMGVLLIASPHAESALNYLLTNDLRKIKVGQAQYTLMCNDAGGTIDDLIVYRVEPSVYMLVINATRIEDDLLWINDRINAPVVVNNISNRTAVLALQGPSASNVLIEAKALPPFHIQKYDILGVDCWVARTGYTGEDGYEILCDNERVNDLWLDLLSRGQNCHIQPCGLGARDVLRLEACYPLYGNELTENITPMEAGLGKFVSLEKNEFIAKDVLLEQKECGTKNKLVAFRMIDKSPPPRTGYPIIIGEGEIIGNVTSGTQSPVWGVGIGMGYVETAYSKIGTTFDVKIRGKNFKAQVERKPLFKKD